MADVDCLTAAIDSQSLSEKQRSAAEHDRRTNAQAVAQAVERAVRRDTRRGVRELAVDVAEDGVHLRGRCSTFYCKQLAQHAAAAVIGRARLHNDIEVW